MACLLALAITPVLTSAPAFADVRKADTVMGQSVDSRGLSVADCPSIDAQYAIVMSDAGTVYFERDADSPTAIASITKVMTAIVALENVKDGTLVEVSENAASVGESSASLQEGDTLAFNDALKALLLSSGNDAAVAIAECIGAQISNGTAQGAQAEAVFVDSMNAKAQEMGLENTVFCNPHGLDDGEFAGNQHSCAVDVAKMIQLAMKDDTFRTIVSTAQTDISVTHADGSQGVLHLETTDEMLGNFDGACGVKTGFTDLAGYCFAGASNKDGHDLYAVALDSSSSEQRFTDVETLLQWVFDHNIEYPLVHSDQSMDAVIAGQSVTVPIVAEVAHADWTDKTVKATLKDPQQSVSIFDLNGNINQTVVYDALHGNVHVGDKVGTITFKQRNNVLVTVDMIACEEVPAPSFLESIGIWWNRLFHGTTPGQTVAYSVLVNQTPLVNQKGNG